jgi:hypothetical protein
VAALNLAGSSAGAPLRCSGSLPCVVTYSRALTVFRLPCRCAAPAVSGPADWITSSSGGRTRGRPGISQCGACPAFGPVSWSVRQPGPDGAVGVTAVGEAL